MLKKSCLFVLCLFFALNGQSQKREKIDPALTEDWSSKPMVMTGVPLKWDIPSDAIILLGNNTNQWRTKDTTDINWTLENGILTVKSVPVDNNIYTRMSFEDCHLHLEWRSPVVVKGTGQGRGNSGVFLQSRYEIQVLDNYNNETYFNGQAGSIYKQTPPLANVCSKTGEWNTYDIIYKAPKFDIFGNKMESGRITLIHNGIVVQNNTELAGTTEYRGSPQNRAHRGAPIMLQDHGDLVSYRNIWIRRL